MTEFDKFLVVEKLDIHNYVPWSIKMKFFLVTKGLWGAVNGTEDEIDHAKSEKALALIGLNVKDHHLSTINAYETAGEAWEKLQSTYRAKTEARRMQLRRELTSLRLREDRNSYEPLTKYFSRALDIRDQLEAIGQTVDAQDLKLAVLSGLPSTYDTAMQILTMAKETADLPELLSLLLPVEQTKLVENMLM
jgi:hypothetical protein